MGAPDKAIFISMILESLIHGSWSIFSSSCSITNKLGPGIFTVMFGFTLWVLIYERRGRINMRLLLPALALYALATAVSQIFESILLIDLMLDCIQAFDRYRICDCGSFHHIPRYTRWPYGSCHKCNECDLPPQIFVLRSTNSLGWLLPCKKISLHYHSSLRCTWYNFADLSVLSRMATQYMDNNSTNPALDILCW